MAKAIESEIETYDAYLGSLTAQQRKTMVAGINRKHKEWLKYKKKCASEAKSEMGVAYWAKRLETVVPHKTLEESDAALDIQYFDDLETMSSTIGEALRMIVATGITRSRLKPRGENELLTVRTHVRYEVTAKKNVRILFDFDVYPSDNHDQKHLIARVIERHGTREDAHGTIWAFSAEHLAAEIDVYARKFKLEHGSKQGD